MSNLAVSGEIPPRPTPLQYFLVRAKVAYYAKPSSLPLFFVPVSGITIHPIVQARYLEGILVISPLPILLNQLRTNPY